MEKSVIRDIKNLERLIDKRMDSEFDPQRYLNYTQYRIVSFLMNHEDENICQKDLEAETNLKKASITGCIDALVEKGFVRRVQSDTDKRKNYVVLTEKAKEMRDKFENKAIILNDELTTGIPEEDLTIFFRALDKMHENLQEE